jgi:predicted adenylyl cyclase CyaB
MGRNVEIKARAGDLDEVERLVAQKADEGPIVLHQEDTFFPSAVGRLKLRKFDDTSGELIGYTRPDAEGPKTSQYSLHPTGDPDGLRDLLAATLGVRGVVRKRRVLYLVGRTRVHLDRVEGLGDFVELEVVLEPDATEEDGTREAHDLMAALGIRELVRGAYIDLLLE